MHVKVHKAARNRLNTKMQKEKREMPGFHRKPKTSYFYKPLYEIGNVL